MKRFFSFKKESDPLKQKLLTHTSSHLPASLSSRTSSIDKEHSLREFSFQELKIATNGFDKKLMIGVGCYKGKIWFSNKKTLVAIKRLNITDNKYCAYESTGRECVRKELHETMVEVQCLKLEWLAEVQFLGLVDHPNLLKLLGYCCEDGERVTEYLLVYEYMPNKSLEDYLFNRATAFTVGNSRATTVLPWKTRLQIMLGAAEGLDYLHSGMEVQVTFREFKASKILLDDAFKPKLSDYGLTKSGLYGDHARISRAMAWSSCEYYAPEYWLTRSYKTNNDVYSFGVVLYEIITGRRALDRNRPTKERRLIGWAKQYPVKDIIDPEIRNQCSIGSVEKVAKLADSCLSGNPNSRPTTAQIVEILKEAVEEFNEVLSLGAGERPFQCRD